MPEQIIVHCYGCVLQCCTTVSRDRAQLGRGSEAEEAGQKGGE